MIIKRQEQTIWWLPLYIVNGQISEQETSLEQFIVWSCNLRTVAKLRLSIYLFSAQW